MLHVGLVGELIQVVRHTRKDTDIGGILLGDRFLDIAIHGKVIDYGGEGTLFVSAPSFQLIIVVPVKVDLDSIHAFLSIV